MLDAQATSPSTDDFPPWSELELAEVESIANGLAPVWSPPSRDAKDARKAFFVAKIRDWIATRRERPGAPMSLQAIRANQDRFLLQRVLLDSVAEACRAFPTTDRMFAVLVCDILISDSSSRKYSDVSAERLGCLLSCDDRAVRVARKRIAEHNVLMREKRPGFTDKHWPVINPDFAGQDLHPTWWLDATSNPPAPRGKPPKERFGGAGVKVHNSGSVTPTLYDNPGSQTSKPRIGDADEFSKEFAKEKSTPVPSGQLGQETSPPKKKKPRSEIAGDWEPALEAVAWVRAHYSATDQQIAEQAELFRNHHQGKGSLMADWAAAWRTWWGAGYHRISKRSTPSARAAQGASTPMPPDWWRNPSAVIAIGSNGWRQLIKTYNKGEWPIEMLGPAPGREGCVVPREVLREFGLPESSTGDPRP